MFHSGLDISAVARLHDSSLLAALSLHECHPSLLGRVWEFPCGLMVADELVARHPPLTGNEASTFRLVHRGHHEHARQEEPWQKEPWQIIGEITEFERGYRIDYVCSCVEEKP